MIIKFKFIIFFIIALVAIAQNTNQGTTDNINNSNEIPNNVSMNGLWVVTDSNCTGCNPISYNIRSHNTTQSLYLNLMINYPVSDICQGLSGSTLSSTVLVMGTPNVTNEEAEDNEEVSLSDLGLNNTSQNTQYFAQNDSLLIQSDMCYTILQRQESASSANNTQGATSSLSQSGTGNAVNTQANQASGETVNANQQNAAANQNTSTSNAATTSPMQGDTTNSRRQLRGLQNPIYVSILNIIFFYLCL